MSPSSLWFLGLYGASLVLLLTAASLADDYETTSALYEVDDSSLIVSFFSNTSLEELERFSQQFMDVDEEDEDEENVTTVEPFYKHDVKNVSSLPVRPDFAALAWTLLLVVGVNLRQMRREL